MAFYIRKAFKAGPVRLNLSKGGLGLSGGITGARIGINRMGTYVHGGRHGLYYRKYLKRGSRSAGNRRGRADMDSSGRVGGPVSLFRDTGVTFAGKSAQDQTLSRTDPTFPSPKVAEMPLLFLLLLTALLFFFSFSDGASWLLFPALLLFTASLAGMGWHGYWKRKAESELMKIEKRSSAEKSLVLEEPVTNERMPKRWQAWLFAHLHAVIAELAMRHEEMDTLPTLRMLDQKLPFNREFIEQTRASLLGTLLDEMLEDHLLSEEEEQALLRLLDELRLPSALIQHELDRIHHYSRIRKEMEKPLEEIQPGIALVRGEVAYHLFEPVRLLHERVLNRFQRDGVQYRELGYEVDMEGKCILTDRRILIIDRGSREYRLNRILGVTADPEAGLVELTLSNRKNPVLITVQEPLLFAARVEKVLQESSIKN